MIHFHKLRSLIETIATAALGLLLAATPLQAQPTLRFGGSSTPDLYNSVPTWQNNNWLNNSLIPNQDWRLGVQCDNLETGVYVRQVAPNSAAAKANLEVGDIIVAVGGQQVGIVDGRPIDLGIEIKRRADTMGNVTLLIQDGRRGSLASVRVRLDNGQSTLQGVVVRRDRAYLPAGSQLVVTMENLTRPFYVVRGGEAKLMANPQGDTPFEINYDPAYVDPNDIYQLRARILLGDRAIYDTVSPVRVLGNNPNNNVFVEVSPIQQNSLASASSPVITAGYGGTNPLYVQQFETMYKKYLGRYPTMLERAAFDASPTQAALIESLPITLMAGQTYFDAVGNNNTLWITSVFQQIIGRPPTIEERERWLQYFADLRGSRVEVLRALYQSKR